MHGHSLGTWADHVFAYLRGRSDLDGSAEGNVLLNQCFSLLNQ